MPYTLEHKAKTRGRIVEAARVMFNRDGFAEVTIDQVMAHAGLTRGGFYNHFRNKEELYAEAVASFLNGRGKTWRDDAGVDPQNGGPDTVRAMINTYLSPEHARDLTSGRGRPPRNPLALTRPRWQSRGALLSVELTCPVA